MPWDDRPEKVGRLTILEYVGKSRTGTAGWRVRCDCGIVFITQEPGLRAGTPTQCYTCRRREFFKRAKTHGRCHHALYDKWKRLKARGDLGPEWLDIERFIADIGSLKGETLVRPDKFLPFGPDNFSSRQRIKLPLTAEEAEALKQATGQERRRLARLARARGATYKAIGKAMGITAITARDTCHLHAHTDRIRKIKKRIAAYTKRLLRMTQRLYEYELLEKADKARLAAEIRLRVKPVFVDPEAEREVRVVETPEAPG